MRFMGGEPAQHGSGHAGRRAVAKDGGVVARQVRVARRLSRGALVEPEDRRAQRGAAVVHQDHAVHLAGDGEAGDGDAARIGGGFGERRVHGDPGGRPPVFRLGLRPAGGGHPHLVGGSRTAENAAVPAGREDLDAARPEVDPENRRLWVTVHVPIVHRRVILRKVT